MELQLSRGRAASVSDALDSTAFVALLLFVAIAPFPWGGVLPGGTFRVEAFAFAIAAIALAVGATREGWRGFPWLPPAALAALGCLGVIQLLPMQAALVTRLSPVSAKIYGDADSVLRLFGRPGVPPRISIAPLETISTIFLTLAYAALFIAAAVLCRTRVRRRWLMAVLFGTSGVHAIVAAFQVATIDRVHGAFINANHFAGYLEIALAFAFGIIWAEVLMGSDRVRLIRDRGARLENRAIAVTWRILLWGVIAGGIALTRSRGGVLAASLTTITLIAMALSRRRGERASVLTLTSVALGVAFVAYTTGTAAILRFLSADPRDLAAEVRVSIWRTSVEAWRLFPTFGDGLGAFKEAFRRVQPRDIDLLVEQAHNDFLQLLVTGGWIGAALGVIVFGSLFVILYGAWLTQRHREEAAFVLSAFGAVLSLTLHGLVEFNMSIPAIPATLAVLVGAGTAAGRYRSS